MDVVLYFFRDTLSGTYYFIYCFVCLLLMFSIIGYLFKQKYAKVEIKLNTSQPQQEEKVKEKQKQVQKNEQVIQKKEVIAQKPIQAISALTPQKPNINVQPQINQGSPQTVNQNENIQPSITQQKTQVVNQNSGVNNTKANSIPSTVQQVQQTPIQPQPSVPLKKIEIPDIK